MWYLSATMGERDTLETDIRSVALVIGGPDRLVEAVARACEPIPGARVETASLRDAATKVAALWPFAIVMSDDVYCFDPEEFDALSRDVAARLVTMATDRAQVSELLGTLGPALRDAIQARWAD